MYERFTDHARNVMREANLEVQRLNRAYISTEHVLMALVKENDCVAAQVFKSLSVDEIQIRRDVEKFIQIGHDRIATDRLPQSPRAKRVVECAMEEARKLNHDYVGTGHILLGLLHDEFESDFLMYRGLTLENVREAVLGLEDSGLETAEKTRQSRGLWRSLNSWLRGR